MNIMLHQHRYHYTMLNIWTPNEDCRPVKERLFFINHGHLWASSVRKLSFPRNNYDPKVVWEKCYAAHTQVLYCTTRGNTCRDYKQYRWCTNNNMQPKHIYTPSSWEQQVFLRNNPSKNPLHSFLKLPSYYPHSYCSRNGDDSEKWGERMTWTENEAQTPKWRGCCWWCTLGNTGKRMFFSCSLYTNASWNRL